MNKEFKLGIRVLVAKDGLSSDLMSKVMGGNDGGTVVPSCSCKAPKTFVNCPCNSQTPLECECYGSSSLSICQGNANICGCYGDSKLVIYGK